MEQRLPDTPDAFSQASQASPANAITTAIIDVIRSEGLEITIMDSAPPISFINHWINHRDLSDETNEVAYLLARSQNATTTLPPHDWVQQERLEEYNRCRQAISIIRSFMTSQPLADATIEKANKYLDFLGDLSIRLYIKHVGDFKIPALQANTFQQQQDNTTNNNPQLSMNININGGNNNINNIEKMIGNINYDQQPAKAPKQLPQALTHDQALHLYEFMLNQHFIDPATDLPSALYLLGVSSEPPASLRPIRWFANRQLLRELLIPAFHPAFENKLITQKAFCEELVPGCFVGENFKPITLHNNAPYICKESDDIKEFLKNDF